MLRIMFYISISDINQWGSRGLGECGKVENSLSKPRGGKILRNYIKL